MAAGIAATIALPIILETARKIGAPIIKSVLEKYVGKTGADIAGTAAEQIIDRVSDRAGTPVENLPDLPQDALEPAVIETERKDAPEILAEWNRTLELSIEMQKAEMEAGGPLWTWGWRPFWMWLLAFFWVWTLVLLPAANGLLDADIPPIDAGILMTLTGAYLALYMGGHTVKNVFGKR